MSDAAQRLHVWCKKYQQTLACAESLTAGNVQAMICAQSGASQFFRGGITAYDIAIKSRLLGVDATHAQTVNAVSPQVAREMAAGACQLFDADIGLATTGYAEPYPAAGINAPQAYFAVIKRGVVSPLAEGRVDGAGLMRIEMQHKVAFAVLQAATDALENL